MCQTAHAITATYIGDSVFLFAIQRALSSF